VRRPFACGGFSAQAAQLPAFSAAGVLLEAELYLRVVRHPLNPGLGALLRPQGVRGGGADAGLAAGRLRHTRARAVAFSAGAHPPAVGELVAAGFQRTDFWQSVRESFVPPVPAQGLPQSLLARFQGATCHERLVHLLCFVCPLSVSVIK